MERPSGDAQLRLSVACPRCGQAGWIAWNKLSANLRCSNCSCQFVLSRSGEFRDQADLPHVRYDCPRCRQSGRIPAEVPVRHAECRTCRLPLVMGPDQRLHGAAEAAEMRRQAPHSAARQTDGRSGWELHRLGQVALYGGMAAAVLVIAVTVWWARSPATPAAMARRFTAACLSRDRNAASRYVAEDDVEQAEFTRWWLRYFPSISDSHRPEGDRIKIAAEVAAQNGEKCLVKVELKSDFIGTRSHVQIWRKDGQAWTFDVLASLSAALR
ncbi:MAG: hypothetical protein U0795_10925 [Pirellulales bacterium]